MRAEPRRQNPHLVDLARGNVRTELPGRRSRASAAAVRASSVPISSAPTGPQSTSRPPTIQKQSNSAPSGCAPEQQARTRVGRLEHAAQPSEDDAQPLAPAAQRRGALVALLGRCRMHLALDVVQQRPAGLTARRVADEQSQHLVEPPPIKVRIEIAQARRQAAPHLTVRRRVLTAGQPPPAVPQPEQRVELLNQLDAPAGDHAVDRS